MRAPDSNTFISDAQWQAIHSILGHIGIDAETVRVGRGKDKVPLRSELDRWTAWYGTGEGCARPRATKEITLMIMQEEETMGDIEDGIAISEYLVKILQDSITPDRTIVALVGALVIARRASNIRDHTDIEVFAEAMRQLIIQMNKEITSELVH
jgi:hypothetical protein